MVYSIQHDNAANTDFLHMQRVFHNCFTYFMVLAAGIFGSLKGLVQCGLLSSGNDIYSFQTWRLQLLTHKEMQLLSALYHCKLESFSFWVAFQELLGTCNGHRVLPSDILQTKQQINQENKLYTDKKNKY